MRRNDAEFNTHNAAATPSPPTLESIAALREESEANAVTIPLGTLERVASQERHSPTCRCTQCACQAFASWLLRLFEGGKVPLGVRVLRRGQREPSP